MAKAATEIIITEGDQGRGDGPAVGEAERFPAAGEAGARPGLHPRQTEQGGQPPTDTLSQGALLAGLVQTQLSWRLRSISKSSQVHSKKKNINV